MAFLLSLPGRCNGKIMHGEIRIGGSPIMFHDAMMGFKGPKALGGSPVGLWIYVEEMFKEMAGQSRGE